MNAIANMVRLTKAGVVLAWSGARVLPEDANLPAPLVLFGRVTAPLRKNGAGDGNETKLSAALTSLGPSYIKLGQFLATRDDIIGRELAADLATLQDRLPPFSQEDARKAVEEALGAPVDKLFAEFGPPVAAASIAQVHKAKVKTPDGTLKPVAVKVLRPGIEQRFKRDLDSYFFAARALERFHPRSRRLRPVAVVDTLAKSVAIEMDLRMEAAAISEMAENTKNDDGFRVPVVDWTRSARRVLTLEWIDGIPISDHGALRKAGYDLKAIGARLMQSFLRHAMRDGFFHADMHPGNLFIDAEGRIAAVDFGIMGRLGAKERRFLAEILYGFLNRNYTRVAEVHFEAGYVPRKHSIAQFAQALRAIGEPILDRPASEISMAQLLGQLFQYTEVFDMQTRPELLLLQKTMVVVEGVGRSLDPDLNIWVVAEPVVREWMEKELGAGARLEAAAEGAASVGRFMGELPKLLGQAERTAGAFAALMDEGLRLDDQTVERLAEAQARQNRANRLGIWVVAIALVAIALALLF
ncbi:2-polyprenylphenol 6-hydroxylase [Methyloceanibacter sp.]|uniref:2-polyprenylphenol 6-hydroxylase n=1 Tax=Methyloceanibacter sp. TaxID=1965321 RepID=UPI002D4F796E|nr:2-polyprenylphenol 6-hydroxylase [Methyloceanibacter sp.]HZP08414.1 2-polyprenylphenol 6-hydroxylase [Methyloceanibacter sp.]